MREKLKLDLPVIVEGKYDKITLSAVLDATIIPTGGFSIFKNHEKMALIRRLGEAGGVIVLTDSDGGGKLIRSHLSSALPKDKIFHLYTPAIAGKEKRKREAGKEGLLGVEGMDADRLWQLFLPFATNAPPLNGENAERGTARTADSKRGHATENAAPLLRRTLPPRERRLVEKRDLYADGLSGGGGAAARRDRLAALFDLPHGMTANALLEAINLLYTYEEYRTAVAQLGQL